MSNSEKFYDEYKKARDTINEIMDRDAEMGILAKRRYEAEKQVEQLTADIEKIRKSLDAVPTNIKVLLDELGIDILEPTKPFTKHVREFRRKFVDIVEKGFMDKAEKLFEDIPDEPAQKTIEMVTGADLIATHTVVDITASPDKSTPLTFEPSKNITYKIHTPPQE